MLLLFSALTICLPVSYPPIKLFYCLYFYAPPSSIFSSNPLLFLILHLAPVITSAQCLRTGLYPTMHSTLTVFYVKLLGLGTYSLIFLHPGFVFCPS